MYVNIFFVKCRITVRLAVAINQIAIIVSLAETEEPHPNNTSHLVPCDEVQTGIDKSASLPGVTMAHSNTTTIH